MMSASRWSSCRIHSPLFSSLRFLFFFNDTATTEIYTLSLHDALPISCSDRSLPSAPSPSPGMAGRHPRRSEEHTSELQSRVDLVCRLLLEKKKKKIHLGTEQQASSLHRKQSHPPKSSAASHPPLANDH